MPALRVRIQMVHLVPVFCVLELNRAQKSMFREAQVKLQEEENPSFTGGIDSSLQMKVEN